MKLFFSLLKIQMKIVFQYRKTLLLSLIGDPVLLLITTISLKAIYAYNQADTIVGYELSQMVWYFAAITLVWQCIWNNADMSISNKILSGDLSIVLLKPLSLLKYEMAGAWGSSIMGFDFQFIPCFLIFSIIFFPSFMNFFSIVKFLFSVSLSLFIYFFMNFAIGLCAFSIKSIYSIQNIKLVIISLAAGASIPIDFYPLWARNILSFLPFPYLFYWPIQLLLNKKSFQGTVFFLKIILFQFLWLIILFLLVKFFWKAAIKKYCAVGG